MAPAPRRLLILVTICTVCTAVSATAPKIFSVMFPGNAIPTDFVGTVPGRRGPVQAGFVYEALMAACNVCGWECVAVRDSYDHCWERGGHAGVGLLGDFYDACGGFYDTYERRLSTVFSMPVLTMPTAGLLVRAEADGGPAIRNLTGAVVALIGGWSTSRVALLDLHDPCTGVPFSGYTTLTPLDAYAGPDEAMRALLSGAADALFVEDRIIEERKGCATSDCDASLWGGLGTNVTWLRTGLEYAAGGMTPAMAHKRSRHLLEELNPCIEEAVSREAYAELCRRYNLTARCLPNKHIDYKERGDSRNDTALCEQ